MRSLHVSKTLQKPASKACVTEAGFTDHSIEALYITPFKVTKNIKLLMFQFKINHHILYTRDKLFRASIIENDECQLCGVKQTLEHLFVECRHVHSFWNLFAFWWNSCNLPKVALTNNGKIYAHHPGREAMFSRCQPVPDSSSLLHPYCSQRKWILQHNIVQSIVKEQIIHGVTKRSSIREFLYTH